MSNIWFIHIPKCGGTSVKQALDIDTGHQTLKSMKDSMADKYFNKAYIITFVRNPFDRFLSLYRFNKKHNIKGVSEDISFREWFYQSIVYNNKPFYYNPDHFLPCYDWVSIDDTIMAHFVGKLENINTDFSALTAKLGVNASVKHLNSTQRGSEQYDRQMRSIVKDKYYKYLKQWYSSYL